MHACSLFPPLRSKTTDERRRRATSVRLLDIVHADQKLYLVFEFLDVDLKRYMEAGNSQGTPITLELCQVCVCHFPFPIIFFFPSCCSTLLEYATVSNADCPLVGLLACAPAGADRVVTACHYLLRRIQISGDRLLIWLSALRLDFLLALIHHVTARSTGANADPECPLFIVQSASCFVLITILVIATEIHPPADLGTTVLPLAPDPPSRSQATKSPHQQAKQPEAS